MAQSRVISAAWKKISGGEPPLKDVDYPSLLGIWVSGFASHTSMRATRLSRVWVSPYPWSIILMIITTLDLRYSPMGSSSSFIISLFEVLIALELGQAFNLQYEVTIFCARVCPHRGRSPDHPVGWRYWPEELCEVVNLICNPPHNEVFQ